MAGQSVTRFLAAVAAPPLTLLLIVVGLCGLIFELLIPGAMLPGVAGAVALAAGLVLLVDADAMSGGLPDAVTLAIVGLAAAVVLLIVGAAARARRWPIVSGREDLIAAEGVVVQPGWARVRGELWRIASHRPLTPGSAIRVVRVEGLLLQVEPVKSAEGGGVP